MPDKHQLYAGEILWELEEEKSKLGYIWDIQLLELQGLT